MHARIEAEFTGRGPILTNLPRYEKRGGQLGMALAVADALTSETNLMVEAGTGIGKSFAYLVPLIYWTLKEGRKAVVATGTKVLQNQLVAKDLPFLADHSDIPFKFEVLYGQENFFCRRRAGMVAQYGLFDDPDQASELERIATWASQESGVFEDYQEPVSPGLKGQISRRSEACLRRNCTYYVECPYYRKRRAAEQADIIVINHHLFFAHLESAGKLLPEFGAAVFDEAQRLEQIAASYFGVRLTSIGLSLLCSRIYNPRRGSGIAPKLPGFPALKPKLRALIEETRRAADNFFMNIAGLLKPYEYKKRIRAAGCVPNDLEQPLDDLSGFLFEKAKDTDDENLSFELISLGDRVSVAKGAVVSFLDMADANSVYWIEASDRNDRVSIHSALIDVSEMMRNSVWSQDWINILTSATLTVGKRFDFTAERIGFKDRTLWIGSPFDYEQNALTYVGHDLVSPKHEAWAERMPQRVGELLKASEGRALVLFTSYATLNKTVEALEEEVSKKHTVLVQGRTTRNVLLDEFRFDTSSVLFATTSFWEGVDIPGESLVLLVITRLPFEVPDDPRAEAILEGYRSQGREPFTEYQLPLSVLRFRQGIGRLIRRDDDYGVIAVLDSRIVKRAYGRLFLDSMPPAPVVFNLLEVQRFFENH
ncbi:putative ATP-dependent DNA helicase YoaA [subsurface metagenome]|nr:DEAD/DEAH box helicase [bacterium]